MNYYFCLFLYKLTKRVCIFRTCLFYLNGNKKFAKFIKINSVKVWMMTKTVYKFNIRVCFLINFKINWFTFFYILHSWKLSLYHPNIIPNIIHDVPRDPSNCMFLEEECACGRIVELMVFFRGKTTFSFKQIKKVLKVKKTLPFCGTKSYEILWFLPEPQKLLPQTLSSSKVFTSHHVVPLYLNAKKKIDITNILLHILFPQICVLFFEIIWFKDIINVFLFG